MKKEDLIIVNINDIEDVVLAKYKIDTANPNIEGRSNLNDFMNEYCNLSDIAMIDDSLKAFKFITKFNMSFLFISNPDDLETIIKLLKKCNYDLDSLKEISFMDMMNPEYIKNNIILIRNSKYYNI